MRHSGIPHEGPIRNRIRGLTSANIAYSGFETSRRVPLDPISADAVEISRGPNANIFGLGNAGGTVEITGIRFHSVIRRRILP